MPEVFDNTLSYYNKLKENKDETTNIVQTDFWQKTLDKLPESGCLYSG